MALLITSHLPVMARPGVSSITNQHTHHACEEEAEGGGSRAGAEGARHGREEAHAAVGGSCVDSRRSQVQGQLDLSKESQRHPLLGAQGSSSDFTSDAVQ